MWTPARVGDVIETVTAVRHNQTQTWNILRQQLGGAGSALREREVLELIARGLSNREIATELFVEESTIRTHVKRIQMKLQLRDRVQIVIFAYETGVNQPAPHSRPSSR
jgi:DNA-binding NarL/FixJ family response regulator